uniref:NADH-ubiquinone oxidoreductase chain 6 n=1 Tax=Staphylinidae sp. BMNH 1274633 TaxID=1796577 RepID=A0A126TE67_9COLE|nr:NADH dehydrogenase subunit 6 [Staphylinidae sp. BMNH 1274633]
MLLWINCFISLTFLFLNHPMSMGTALFIQTIMISLITGLFNMNFWFSYLLFLIMVGGMLILFMYMTSIASNEIFNYTMKLMVLFFTFIGLLLLLLLLIKEDLFMLNYSLMFKENWNISYKFNYMSKYFNYPSVMIIYLMIIYLFITLVATVKITKIEYGPLRQMF